MDRPQALRSAFESFLENDYVGAPGVVNVFSIVDIFCRDEDDAAQLARHLTSTIIYGGSHCDHGEATSDGHFDFAFHPNSVKARFILWGSPDWQSRVLAELHDCSREFAQPPMLDSASNKVDRYGYAN